MHALIGNRWPFHSGAMASSSTCRITRGVRTPTLHNDGHTPVAFTITHNHYLPGHPQTVRVAPHDSRTWTVHPLEAGHGWYDLTVTASADEAWSQRFAGHLETGRPSVSG